MAKNETKKIDKRTLQEDDDRVVVFKNMADYHPQREEFSLEKITQSDDELTAAHELVVNLTAQLEGAKDAEIAAQWKRRNRLLGGSEQVIAQFGKNSDQYQSLGYKKKSEYSSRKTKPSNNPPTP